MKDSLYDRLWRRECGNLSSQAGVRDFYGSKEWVNDLDIVNELGGHTGCVNALSWSRSGRLLASGSDDQHLNIYSYQPESSDAPFALNTTVQTGHKANIFSVKFMPHSNDGTLITCAGDSQVRVFDIEYASQNANTAATSAFSASARSRRFNNFFDGARYLSEGNTNARVYRSHADRVKRIVTESSPYLFLTCSEDGEVRQWDLRQPSSAYPTPKGGQGFMAYRPGLQHDDSNVPPPLISYKKFSLDLNTISCSPSQPHYIALGGAHAHCFLHDRRMLGGRDMMSERGTPTGSTPSIGSADDEFMGKATRCVRRFAPRGKRRVRDLDDGHITACKISDANPDEMVVSWSGDHIYSFDLIRSSDARETSSEREWTSKTAKKHSKRKMSERKRKRPKPASRSSEGSEGSGDRHHSRRRSNDADTLRVQFENGETSHIPISGVAGEEGYPSEILERARYSVLNEAQRLSRDIAKALVKMRQSLFSLEETVREAAEGDPYAHMPYTASFESALMLASKLLPQMDAVIREWGYPMNPSQETVAFQQTLRHHRQASWRFVQAAGTLSLILKSPSNNVEESDLALYPEFQKITPAPSEDESIERESQFGYDFLKAILLWLQGGRQDLLAGFKCGSCPRRQKGRFPIPEEAGEEAIEKILVPYLHGLAGETPIVNVDVSPFEHDSTRLLFQTQYAAVTAFSNAVKLPLENLGNTAARIDKRRVSNPTSQVRSLDRASASRFWILRVGRGILLSAGTGVNYSFVNRAFGGLLPEVDESDSDLELDRYLEESQQDIDPDEPDERVQSINLIRGEGSTQKRNSRANQETDPINDGESALLSESSGSESEDDMSDDNESDTEERTEINIDLEESDGSEIDSGGDSDSSDTGEPISFRRRRNKSFRGEVENDTPCSSHTRVYRGHCNIKTVKDVNFFGLNDEYVVSGSDSGHVFIWDRKTAKLVNILEGDSEVVNVIQGHPYEPTMAVSGIDNTIKIFNPDQNAQEQAREGINILDPDNTANLLGEPIRNVGGLQTRKRLHDSYRIMSQNDVERRGGMSEAHITRSMLAQLAATLRGRQTLGGEVESLGSPGERPTVVLDDNCTLM